ncbi:hypothetical protein BT96DRAFT_961520 [Gymnopus androsaceus JB14]|uniref:t-SNARE coiled-coil homology domain-containing protein n=1 Tax=Gymnopus androsaceus JB14 TaxID=1447944 RepID=A0A6A4IJJ0_9AGAR|nr:hypothetical protein BT96DRAFT_961520 [Gymnopus androsaceus JB14]
MSQRYNSSLHNRSSLLPNHSTPPASGRSSPFGGQRYADDLEGQNDEAIEGLNAKVRLLKDLTIGIRDEVKDSAIQLTQMNDAFAETGGILSGTMRRRDAAGLWYIVFLIFVFWFFVVMWWFRR